MDIRPQPKMFLPYAYLRQQKKAEIAARVNDTFLLAAGKPSDLEEIFLAAVEAWYASDNRSAETWRAMLKETLGAELERETKLHGKRLSKIFEVDDDTRTAAIETAIEATEDLRLRLLSAEDNRNNSEDGTGTDDSLTAAAWGLKSLLTGSHQRKVIDSIIGHAKNTFEYLTFKQRRFEAGFTGRRRFEAGDPNGRHGSIHEKIDLTGEGWQLGDREVNGKRYRPTFVRFVGDDPETPTEWSGTTSRITYEHRDRRGRVTWVAA